MAHLRAPLERLGYAPLPVPRALTRSEAVKQFGAAARLAGAQVAGQAGAQAGMQSAVQLAAQSGANRSDVPADAKPSE